MRRKKLSCATVSQVFCFKIGKDSMLPSDSTWPQRSLFPEAGQSVQAPYQENWPIWSWYIEIQLNLTSFTLETFQFAHCQPFAASLLQLIRVLSSFLTTQALAGLICQIQSTKIQFTDWTIFLKENRLNLLLWVFLS